jgi:hypothetical protein
MKVAQEKDIRRVVQRFREDLRGFGQFSHAVSVEEKEEDKVTSCVCGVPQ